MTSLVKSAGSHDAAYGGSGLTGCHRALRWTGKVAALPESLTEATLLLQSPDTHVRLQLANMSRTLLTFSTAD